MDNCANQANRILSGDKEIERLKEENKNLRNIIISLQQANDELKTIISSAAKMLGRRDNT